jgi:hypothetical protein
MAGVVETTNTFATNDVITSTAMNNIIDQTLFTSDALSGGTLALVAGKIKVATSGITSNEMAVNAVTTNTIADSAITNAKISASAAIDLSKLATGALPTAITVASANIVNGTIATADIADANITASKLSGAQTGSAPIYGARAWVMFDGTRNASGGTDSANTARFIYASGNVSSVLRLSRGSYQINFTVPMDGAAYAYTHAYSNEVSGSQHAVGFLAGISSSYITVAHYNADNSSNTADKSVVSVCVFK